METTQIIQLAQSILANTAKVNDFLVAKGLPLPSFEASAPLESQIPMEMQDIEKARTAVIDATLQLRDLMLGPRDYLMSFTHNELISMQATLRFGFAKAVPLDGQVTYEQIATTTGVDEDITRRLIRHGITKRIFQEPQKGYVSHSPASKLLVTDPVLADWVGASTDDLWQSASQTVNAMTKWPGSQEPNETGFALANGVDKSSFEIIASNPERARRFGSAMQAFTEGKAYDLKYLSDNYSWASLGKGTVVDVGGSNGFCCIHLAEKFPDLKFVVQDLAPVLTKAEAAVPAALRDRIEFTPHDFLNEQPVKNADVHFFRWVFHNWSDKYCNTILQSLIPALKPGASVVIMDNVLPDPGLLPHMVEERLRSMDLTMAEMQNSKERDMEAWKCLFDRADKRFQFLGGSKPDGSNLWILEAKWAPQ